MTNDILCTAQIHTERTDGGDRMILSFIVGAFFGAFAVPIVMVLMEDLEMKKKEKEREQNCKYIRK